MPMCPPQRASIKESTIVARDRAFRLIVNINGKYTDPTYVPWITTLSEMD